jgi:peroxiredoxin
MKRRVWAGVASAASLAIAAAAWFGWHAGSAPASQFVLLDGTTATTADLRGRVTLVNFWSTACASCTSEMEQIVATYDKYHGRGFDTVAVAMGSDSPQDVAVYAETRHLPFKLALDSGGGLAKAWGDVDSAPTAFLVDRHGAIVKRFVGQPDFDELQRLIERLLAT